MSAAPLTVLVVGATGSIGRLVVDEAIRQGHKVRVLVRDLRRASKLPAGAQRVVGDLTLPDTLAAAVDGIDAIVFDAIGNFFDQLMRSWVQFTRHFVDEQWDRHSPGPLPRDAPIRPHGNHAGNPLLAPGRHPIDVLDGFKRSFAQARLIHADEPLRCGAKNHRCLVAPTMRIGMVDGRVFEQSAALHEHLDHMRIGIEYQLARKQRRRRQKSPVAADRIIDFQVVAPADDVVLEAMARRGVHGARSGIEFDVVRSDDDRIAL